MQRSATFMYGFLCKVLEIRDLQGEQVASLWKLLYERFNVHIDFAYRTFRWDSEANIKSHVHCVIIGFSIAENTKNKQIFDGEDSKICRSINAYLTVVLRKN